MGERADDFDTIEHRAAFGIKSYLGADLDGDDLRMALTTVGLEVVPLAPPPEQRLSETEQARVEHVRSNMRDWNLGHIFAELLAIIDRIASAPGPAVGGGLSAPDPDATMVVGGETIPAVVDCPAECDGDCPYCGGEEGGCHACGFTGVCAQCEGYGQFDARRIRARLLSGDGSDPGGEGREEADARWGVGMWVDHPGCYVDADGKTHDARHHRDYHGEGRNDG